MAQTEVIGIVESKNDSGVKVGGKWYNFSKYSNADFTQIEQGKSYKLIIVNDKFIKQFYEDGESVNNTSNNSTTNPTTKTAVQTSTSSSNTDNNIWEEKDKRIARMNCITNAINLLTHNKQEEKILVEEVLTLADIFMNYIYTGKKPNIKRSSSKKQSTSEAPNEGS